MMLKEDSYYSSRNDSSFQIYACGKNRFCQLGFELIKGKDDAKSNSSNQEVTQFTPIPFFEMKKNLLHRYNHGIVTSSPPHLMSSSTNHNHIIHLLHMPYKFVKLLDQVFPRFFWALVESWSLVVAINLDNSEWEKLHL